MWSQPLQCNSWCLSGYLDAVGASAQFLLVLPVGAEYPLPVWGGEPADSECGYRMPLSGGQGSLGCSDVAGGWITLPDSVSGIVQRWIGWSTGTEKMPFPWISASCCPRCGAGFRALQQVSLQLSHHCVRQKENPGNPSVAIHHVLNSIVGPRSSFQLSHHQPSHHHLLHYFQGV